MTNYPDTLTVEPLSVAPNAVVAVPGSKSITNRALILAALADGRSTLRDALDSDDTRVMIDSLRRLGLTVDVEDAGETLHVTGRGGRLAAGEVELFVGNSGASIRPLTALCALGEGIYRLDGVPRMRERPMGGLLAALQEFGVEAISEAGNGCPPLRIRGSGGLPGGRVALNVEASSQFLTALLMIAPYAQRDVEIEILGALRPFYVEITRRMMAQWGVDVTTEAGGSKEKVGALLAAPTDAQTPEYRVRAGQRYQPQSEYRIEPDASGASYFFAAAALTGGRVTVPGLGAKVLQGDVRFATEVLAEMGCTVTEDAAGITVVGPPPGRLRGVDRDMSAISDTSLTLAAVAPFANSPTRVRNIAHARLQECDRIRAACTELARLGVTVEEHSDGFTVYPAKHFTPAVVQTYHDHRVAMSFALIGLRAPGVVIADPGCVAKTFPDYWRRLKRL